MRKRGWHTGTREGALGAVRAACAALGLLAVALPGCTCSGGQPARGSRASTPPPGASRHPEIPRIDVHTHIALELADEAVALLGRHHVALALNASGGTADGMLPQSIDVARRTGGRLRPYCNVSFRGAGDPGWGAIIHRDLARCRELGGVGVKISKALGLGLVDGSGALVSVDDPRLDPLFEAAGALGLPVLIHSGDPIAFFDPPTPENERFRELSAHPSWSFHGPRPDGMGAYPSWQEVFDQYRNRVARHPGTTFVGAHFGNAPERPEAVEEMLARFPHYVVETGARVPEMGRHPPDRIRRIFERFPDRVLFGTDLALGPDGLTLGSRGETADPPERVPAFFGAHWEYFETTHRAFPHPTPIQGDWTIDGLGLPREILENLYWKNAARVFGLELPSSPPPARTE